LDFILAIPSWDLTPAAFGEASSQQSGSRTTKYSRSTTVARLS